MTRETKVGLLIGLGIILLIGIVVSDHLSKAQKQQSAALDQWAPQVERSMNTGSAPADPFAAAPRRTTPAHLSSPVPLPEELATGDRQMLPIPSAAPSSPLTPLPMPMPSSSNDAGRIASAAGGSLSSPDSARSVSLDQLAHELGGAGTAGAPQPPVAGRVEQVMPTPTGREPIIHYVQPNETLFQIANLYYGSGDYWTTIRDANPGVVTSDGLVAQGARLRVPARAGIRPPAPATPTSSAAPQVAAASMTQFIEVKAGQTLSELAREYLGSSAKWPQLLAENKDQLRSPEQLQVGMKLRLPAARLTPVSAPASAASDGSAGSTAVASGSQNPATYTVRAGDTLSAIAGRTLGNQADWDVIYEANRKTLKSPNDLRVGMVLTIPAKSR